ncbi:hypothetical protein APA_1002 [Pseudanabaena sp. lw0831]|uniref:hypothetical protein n=1 Tax=Pseudanabaena sp. lw0831 TaxID=1357935 RepID=UPI0019162309|nr:hypothetical protein [Pseudanabaena sp. lw0831]GBO53094.1 hypothetical protein APA_1002 [Pseudanabaena sp. lw0831]
MLTSKKKYCCIATYPLSPNSILRRLRIKDAVIDEEGLTKLFENNEYKLLAKNDANGEIDAVIYKSDQEEIDSAKFEKKALKVIEESLKCLQIAFLSIRNQPRYIAKKSDGQQISIDILDYETNLKAWLPETMMLVTSGRALNNQLYYGSLQKIVTVLTVINCENNDKINEYIARFVSLENLSSDPVLHLITLYSLYEYINKNSSQYLENLFKQQGIEERFRFTRNFAAHGTVGERQNVKNFLKDSLGESQQDFYSFDRYNQSHINLINHVISEYQVIIHDYLKEQLGI